MRAHDFSFYPHQDKRARLCWYFVKCALCGSTTYLLTDHLHNFVYISSPQFLTNQDNDPNFPANFPLNSLDVYVVTRLHLNSVGGKIVLDRWVGLDDVSSLSSDLGLVLVRIKV